MTQERTYPTTFHANTYIEWQSGLLNSYSFTPHVDRKGTRHRYRVETGDEIDRGASLIIGDCIHNLRSALDHLAFQVAWLSSGAGSPQGQTKLFIQSDRIKINTSLRSDCRQILDSIQPNQRPALLPVLRHVDALDRIDKHRHLHLLVAAGRWIEGSIPFTREGIRMPLDGLKHGDVALTLVYDPPLLEPDPDLRIHPGVFFGKRGMPSGVVGDSPDMFIGSARRAVEEIIDAFAPLF